MKKFTLSFTLDQLQLLNSAIIELPFKISAPLISHINKEIQNQIEEEEKLKTTSN
jgi:hypothetical protein